MATLTSSSRAASPPIVNTVVTAAILAAFTVFSLWVVHGYGYTGFLSLAAREPWALQMLIDLALALVIAVRWLRADARARHRRVALRRHRRVPRLDRDLAVLGAARAAYTATGNLMNAWCW